MDYATAQELWRRAYQAGYNAFTARLVSRYSGSNRTHMMVVPMTAVATDLVDCVQYGYSGSNSIVSGFGKVALTADDIVARDSLTFS